MPNFENYQAPEKKDAYVRHFNLRGCDVLWEKSKETPHGETNPGKNIIIYGKKSADLAWILAHELAHALEPEKKKRIISASKKIDLNDMASGRHNIKGEHYYPAMTTEEFYAAKRSKQYLQLACGALGISLEDAILSDPPEYLKNWWDRGYFYQWRTRREEQKKLTDKKELRKSGAVARFKKQKPLNDETDF